MTVLQSNLKFSLLTQLIKDDWKQLQITRGLMPWAHEHWLMQSIREQWATEVYINFLIDPVWDAPQTADQRIRLATATGFLPKSAEQALQSICTVDPLNPMDKQILNFVYALNYYRRTQCVDI